MFDPLLPYKPQRLSQRLVRLAQAPSLVLHPNPKRHGRERRVDVTGGPADVGGLGQGSVRGHQITGGPECVAQDDGGESAKAPVLVWQQRQGPPGEFYRARRVPPQAGAPAAAGVAVLRRARPPTSGAPWAPRRGSMLARSQFRSVAPRARTRAPRARALWPRPGARSPRTNPRPGGAVRPKARGSRA